MSKSEKPRYVSLSLMGVTSKQANEAIDAALEKLGDVAYSVFYDDWEPASDEELECEACILAIPHIHTLEEQGKKADGDFDLNEYAIRREVSPMERTRKKEEMLSTDDTTRDSMDGEGPNNG